MATPFLCLPNEEITTAKETHQALPLCFEESDFPPLTGSDYPALSNLANANIFAAHHFGLLAHPTGTPANRRAPEVYASIEPALKLASRILHAHLPSFRRFVYHPEICGKRYVPSDANVFFAITKWIPLIEFAERRNEDIGVVFLECPDKAEKKDVMILDWDHVSILMKGSDISDEKRLAATIWLAVLICAGRKGDGHGGCGMRA